MILVVTICPQTIFLIITGMTRNPFIGMDLLDMGRDLFVDGRGSLALAG